MTGSRGVLPAAIVDSHHHLWDLSAGAPIRYPWLQEAYDPAAFLLGDYAPLCRTYDVAHLRADWQGLPVVATVHVEAECARAQALAEAQWLHEVHAAHGLPHAVVAWCDLLAPDADERLHELAQLPLVRGVRFKPATRRAADAAPATGPGTLADARWPAALERLHRHGFAWDLRVPFWHLEEAAPMLRGAPPLPVVVEHTGLPWDRSERGLAHWRRGLAALAACGEHVVLRLSEFGLREEPWRAEDNERIVREALAIFGWQRCMFGSNFPVASLRVGYAALVQMVADALRDLAPEAQHAVWCGNAVRTYGGQGLVRVGGLCGGM